MALDESLKLRLNLDFYNNRSLTPPAPESTIARTVNRSIENKVEKPKRVADTPLMHSNTGR